MAASEKSMRRVALTSLGGTSIEWYDFFIYGTAAALIFPTAIYRPSSLLWYFCCWLYSAASGWHVVWSLW
jgi:hypothetical protein